MPDNPVKLFMNILDEEDAFETVIEKDGRLSGFLNDLRQKGRDFLDEVKDNLGHSKSLPPNYSQTFLPESSKETSLSVVTKESTPPLFNFKKGRLDIRDLDLRYTVKGDGRRLTFIAGEHVGGELRYTSNKGLLSGGRVKVDYNTDSKKIRLKSSFDFPDYSVGVSLFHKGNNNGFSANYTNKYKREDVNFAVDKNSVAARYSKDIDLHDKYYYLNAGAFGSYHFKEENNVKDWGVGVSLRFIWR